MDDEDDAFNQDIEFTYKLPDSEELEYGELIIFGEREYIIVLASTPNGEHFRTFLSFPKNKADGPVVALVGHKLHTLAADEKVKPYEWWFGLLPNYLNVPLWAIFVSQGWVSGY